MSELEVRSHAAWWEQVAERGRAMVEQVPEAYVRLAQLRTPKRIGVDHGADVLIEGFPRSGNSFLVAWIGRANPGLRIASHMHSSAHILAALRRDIPVVVVIRPPEGALASLAVFNPRVSIDRQIERYRRFHRAVIEVVDEILVSPFPVTTEAPTAVVKALDARIRQPLVDAPPGGIAEVMVEVDRRSLVFGDDHDERRVARPSESRQRETKQASEWLRAHHARDLALLRSMHDELATCTSAVEPPPADGASTSH